MQRNRMVAVVTLIVSLSFVLAVGLAQAQTGSLPNGPTGGGGPGAVGDGFVYQGRLANAAGPVTGSCDFQFSLWDRSGTGAPPTGGVQIGTTEVHSDVAINNGLFDVVLNFSHQFGPTAFTGDGRWLQIAVRCPTGGIGLYTTLSPRQPLWATPYAMSLMPGATISGSVSDGGANLGLLNLYNTNNQGHALVATTYGPTSTAILGLAYASTGFVHGISGSSTASEGSGVFGHASGSQGKGVIGFSPNGMGLYGVNGSWTIPDSSDSVGVYGISTATDGTGIKGEANTGTSAKGVWGRSTSGYAGYFSGNVYISGNLSKSSGSFKIDHPLNPENQYLYHSFVESPDMKNIYDGVVVLDKHGEAVVTLPDWFEALNRDFRYQLTCVGGYAPVYVAEEVHHNAFKIAGGKPGLKVSWQITGIRHDPWADDHRIPVEEAKPAAEQGTYLYPQGYVQP